MTHDSAFSHRDFRHPVRLGHPREIGIDVSERNAAMALALTEAKLETLPRVQAALAPVEASRVRFTGDERASTRRTFFPKRARASRRGCSSAVTCAPVRVQAVGGLLGLVETALACSMAAIVYCIGQVEAPSLGFAGPALALWPS